NSGTATLSLSTFAVGSHTITAYFGGDANYLTSKSSDATFDVHAGATVTITSSVNPSLPNGAVVFTATVTGNGIEPAPTGKVTFLPDNVQIGSTVPLDAMGHATISVNNLTAGSHFISARFNGDTNYATVTSARVIQTVKKAFTQGNLIVERIGDGIVPLS